MHEIILPLTYEDGESVRLFGVAICLQIRDDGTETLVAVSDPGVFAALTECQRQIIADWMRAFQELRAYLPRIDTELEVTLAPSERVARGEPIVRIASRGVAD